MGARRLTTEQGAALSALVAAGRIESVAADHRRAADFMARASAAVAELAHLSVAHVAHDVAYGACHDVGEALLASYGYRTRSGRGQHEALGQYLLALLSAPPGLAAAKRFDTLRRARNRSRYEAAPIGKAQADAAERAARELIAAAQARGLRP